MPFERVAIRYTLPELGLERKNLEILFRFGGLVFIRNGKAEFAVECKLSRTELDPSLRYFKARLKIPR
jgi:hypothetical protein